MSGFWESFKKLFKKETDEEKKEKARIKKQRKRLETVLDYLEDSIQNDFKDLDKAIFLLRNILDIEYKHLLRLNKLQDSPYLTNKMLLSIGECMQNERYDDNNIIRQLKLMTESDSMFNEYSTKSGLINEEIKLKIFDLCNQIENKDVLKKNTKKERPGLDYADRIVADANVLVKYFEFDKDDNRNESAIFTDDEKNQIMKLIDNIISKATGLKTELNSKKENK